MTNGKFDALFVGRRVNRETPLTQREMDLARSVQDVTEEVGYASRVQCKQDTVQRIFASRWRGADCVRQRAGAQGGRSKNIGSSLPPAMPAERSGRVCRVASTR